MTIDTTKLRENVAKEHIGLWVDPTGIILELCDELDQARAYVLVARSEIQRIVKHLDYEDVLEKWLAGTESYETHR